MVKKNLFDKINLLSYLVDVIHLKIQYKVFTRKYINQPKILFTEIIEWNMLNTSIGSVASITMSNISTLKLVRLKLNSVFDIHNIKHIKTFNKITARRELNKWRFRYDFKQVKSIKELKLQLICLSFIIYLPAARQTLDHLQGNSITDQTLFT